jgi:hypothetical protein
MASQTPADEQPRTKLENSDPNQTNADGGAGEQQPAAEGAEAHAETEQESGGGYGNHAPADQGSATGGDVA